MGCLTSFPIGLIPMGANKDQLNFGTSVKGTTRPKKEWSVFRYDYKVSAPTSSVGDLSDQKVYDQNFPLLTGSSSEVNDLSNSL